MIPKQWAKKGRDRYILIHHYLITHPGKKHCSMIAAKRWEKVRTEMWSAAHSQINQHQSKQKLPLDFSHRLTAALKAGRFSSLQIRFLHTKSEEIRNWVVRNNAINLLFTPNEVELNSTQLPHNHFVCLPTISSCWTPGCLRRGDFSLNNLSWCFLFPYI